MAYHLEVAYHNDRPPAELSTRDDITRFVDELLAAGWEHSAAAVYAIDPDDRSEFPDHELIVGGDAETGLGAVRYTGGEGTWYSKGERVDPDGVVFVYFGTGHDFPADAEVPLDAVREAMWELLTTGGERPGCVEWQEDVR